MKNSVRFLILAVLVLALGCTSAFAFTVELDNQRLNLIQANGSVQSFYTADGNLVIGARSDGAVTVTFQEQGRTAGTCAAISNTPALSFAGTISSLTLSSSLTPDYSFTISGSVSKLTVSGSPNLHFAAGCRVGQLVCNNSAARLTMENGASVVNSNVAVNRASGASYSYDAWDSYDSRYPTPSYYDSGIYVSPYVESSGDYTRGNYYDRSTGILYLYARNSSVTLSQAISDVSLPVYRQSNDARVNGSWRWMDGYSSTTAPGTYRYRFTPSDTRLDDLVLTVRFERMPSYNSYTYRPSDRWNYDSRWDNWGGRWDNWNSRDWDLWDRGYSYTRTVQVNIPYDIRYGDRLELYGGSTLIASYDLTPADAGRIKSYTVTTTSPESITANIVRR